MSSRAATSSRKQPFSPGYPLGVWGAGGAESGAAESPPTEIELLRARSSPVVRRIAEEHGIDISQIEGTGLGGRVTKQDILAYVARMPTPGETTAGAEARVAEPLAAPLPTPHPEPRPAARTPLPVYPGDEVIALTPMRRQIAEHMVRSERTAATEGTPELDAYNDYLQQLASRPERRR